MFSAPKIVAKTSETRRPRGQRGFARVIVVLAWVAFWFNTAFAPCCEAVAASFGDPAAVQTVADAHPADDCDETHTDHPDHSPHPPCEHVVSTSSAIYGQAGVLLADHLNVLSVAPRVTIALLPVTSSASSLIAYSTPPPKVPLYLRELHILL